MTLKYSAATFGICWSFSPAQIGRLCLPCMSITSSAAGCVPAIGAHAGPMHWIAALHGRHLPHHHLFAHLPCLTRTACAQKCHPGSWWARQGGLHCHKCNAQSCSPELPMQSVMLLRFRECSSGSLGAGEGGGGGRARHGRRAADQGWSRSEE